MTLFIDPKIIWSLSFFLSAMFLIGAWRKIRDLKGYTAAVAGYNILPNFVVGFSAFCFIGCEIGIGVFLAHPRFQSLASLAAACLLTIYTMAIGANLLQGRKDINCGCSHSSSEASLSPWMILRNSGLIGLCLFLLKSGNERLLLASEYVEVVVIAVVFLILFFTIEELIANQARAT